MNGPASPPTVDEIPIESPEVHLASLARERVLSPIVAVILAAPVDVAGLSSFLSHAVSARVAAAKRNIFSYYDIIFCINGLFMLATDYSSESSDFASSSNSLVSQSVMEDLTDRPVLLTLIVYK